MSALSAPQIRPTFTEQELVAAVRHGSDRAFEELYSRYRSRIASYIHGMVGDHARAEDIAQEVFISALRRLRQTDSQVAFKPWIYEIAKNACIDEFRRARRAREVPLQPDDDSEPEHRLISSTPAPDVAIEAKQSLHDLRGAFHSLSENHHKVIVMRELEGLSYSQIGEQLGMTKPVVESTLFRARRRLTQEYDELVSGRRCEHVMALIDGGEPKALLRLGLRERRQLARHLSHCQPCRRCARMAGVDESLFQAPGIASKVAALLPFGWLRLRRGRAESASSTDGHSFAGLLQPLQSVARFADWVAPASGLGRAAATATAVALAGLGGGVVEAVTSGTQPASAAQIAPAHRLFTRGPSDLSAARHQPAAATRSVSAPNATITLRHRGAGRPGAPAAPATSGTSSPPSNASSSGGRSTQSTSSPGTGGSQDPRLLGISIPHTGSSGGPAVPGVSGLAKTGKTLTSGGSVQLPQLPKVGGVQLPSLPNVSPPKLPLPSSGSSQ